MKYYLIAGEASGDLHGSNLLKGIKAEDPAADFRAWGGDLMEQQGATVVKHYRDLAFMGFSEVLLNLPTILRNFRFCKKDIRTFQPDVLILIDYPGFNLRMARWAKKQGIRVFYYISPQIWAWHTSRVHGIKASVDQMFVILPFEADFYRQFDYEVTFIGHPLLDEIQEFAKSGKSLQINAEKIIALLPGSRRQEISRMLAVMLEMVPLFPQYYFVIAGAPGLEATFYEQLIRALPDTVGKRTHFIQGQTYELLQAAEAALVTSGTATLETALFGVPQVVCYRGSTLSYAIARRLIKVAYISLVNLIAGREIVKELIQDQLRPDHLEKELHRILNPDVRARIQADYQDVREKLGAPGASERCGKKMVALLKR